MREYKHGIVLFLALTGAVWTFHAKAVDAQLKAYSNKIAINWKSESAWEGGCVPTNGDDTVNLYVSSCSANWLVMRLGTFTTGDVTNGPTGGFYYMNGYGARAGFRQMTGFNQSSYPFGYGINNGAPDYTSSYARGGLDFLGSTEKPTLLRAYTLGTAPALGVPDAAGCGVIEQVVNPGFFSKDGAGELQLGGAMELTSALELQSGTVAIRSQEEATTNAPASVPFFHVDASCADKRLGYVDPTDNKTYVTNLLDVSGNGMKATVDKTVSGSFAFGTPTLADHTVNGRALVDFGDHCSVSSGQSAEHPASTMVWSKQSSSICEIFLAVELNRNCGTLWPIGISSAQPFAMLTDGTSVFDSELANRGDVRVNGFRAAARYGRPYDPTELRIVSLALATNSVATAACFGRYGSTGPGASLGGFRLGEAIVYTNRLTEAERRQTIAYLKARWLSADEFRAERAEWDLGDVVVRDGAQLKVAADDVARFRRIRANDAATVVKTGTGVLSVDRLEPANAALSVKGGSVRFTDVAGSAPVIEELPANPLFHFDSTIETSFEFAEDAGSDVHLWHDVRGEGYPTATHVGGYPKRVDSQSPTGLPVVDFPSTTVGGTGERMSFSDCQVNEGFMIWKSKNTSSTYAPAHFSDIGKGALGFRKRKTLLGEVGVTYGSHVAGAVWSVNGQVINPLDDSFDGIGGNDDWVLIHFTSAKPILVNGMAAHSGSYGGGCAIGEMIGYGRVLTDQERRGVEAYLMQRWLGKTHPDNIPWAGALTYADGVPAVLDASCDIAPASVATTATKLTKRGAGTATVGALSASVTTLAVEAGSLAAPPAALANVTALEFDVDADGRTGTVDVDGAFAAPATFGVTVRIGSEEQAKALRGTRIKLIGATSVTDRANVGQWNLTAVGFGRVQTSLVATNDGIYLNVIKPGLMMLVR